jgi:predicted lipid-binding transport protein (Tim44 family)
MIPDNPLDRETFPLQAYEPFDPTILVFAALAVFVIWKLWSVLGVRTDREQPVSRGPSAGRLGASQPPTAPQPPGFGPVALKEDRWKGLAEPESKGWAGLDAVAAADRNFVAPAFIEGAKKAYCMIVEAFARGDRDTLHNLLAREVFDSFAGEITAREQRGETAEAQVVAIDAATVEDAHVDARNVQITVRFVVQLISARRDRAGEVVDGNPNEPLEIIDLWTFAREVASRDPNWKLVATESVR